MKAMNLKAQHNLSLLFFSFSSLRQERVKENDDDHEVIHFLDL